MKINERKTKMEKRFVLYSSARKGFLAGLGVNSERKIVPLVTSDLKNDKVIRFCDETDLCATLETLHAWTGIGFEDFETLVYRLPSKDGDSELDKDLLEEIGHLFIRI
jgi:hypothetical protein